MAERTSFIDAVRLCRMRMLEEQKEKECVQAALTGLVVANGAIGVGAIAASSTGIGLFVLAAAGLVHIASKPLDKIGNHLNLQGELYLWQHTDIKAWLSRAWEAGYPIGQVLAAYGDFCEEVQLSNPQARRRIATAPGFVRSLNRTADHFSGLPTVAKIGEVKQLPMPLDDDWGIEDNDKEHIEHELETSIPDDVMAKIIAYQLKQKQTTHRHVDAVKTTATPADIEATRDYAERQVKELIKQKEKSNAVKQSNRAVESFDFVKDIATASGEPWPKSIMWLGPSRSGKSWAMAASVQESVWHWESQGESVGVWWVSAKNDPKEREYAHDRYYQSCDEVQIDELERDELDEVFGRWYGHLMEFTRAHHFDKRFFVFDEMNLAASFCMPNRQTGFQPTPMASKFWHTLISQAISCSSNGRGKGKGLWLASQMSSMQSLGLSKDQCSVFHEHLVFLSPNDCRSQFEDGALRNSFVSRRLDPLEVRGGETGRFYHYQGRWRGLQNIEMPKVRL